MAWYGVLVYTLSTIIHVESRSAFGGFWSDEWRVKQGNDDRYLALAHFNLGVCSVKTVRGSS